MLRQILGLHFDKILGLKGKGLNAINDHRLAEPQVESSEKLVHSTFACAAHGSKDPCIILHKGPK